MRNWFGRFEDLHLLDGLKRSAIAVRKRVHAFDRSKRLGADIVLFDQSTSEITKRACDIAIETEVVIGRVTTNRRTIALLGLREVAVDDVRLEWR